MRTFTKYVVNPRALFMSNQLGRVSDELKHLKAYIGRVEKRPAFQKIITMQ